MCLIAFAHDVGPYALVLAANRDELHARPTARAATWSDAPDVFGGRDLEQHGTWLGLSRAGRLAAVTNVRSGTPRSGPRSRGDLCAHFLRGDEPAAEFAARVARDRDSYGPFNVVVRAGMRMFYASSLFAEARELEPGIYGVSNAALDVPWPKVVRAKQALTEALALDTESLVARLFAMLAERTQAPDVELPHTGVPLEIERFLSAAFLAAPAYGTRASTVVVWKKTGEVTFEERAFGQGGAPEGEIVKATLALPVE
jgi:uncharacterized protein with NRDE domain